MIKMNEDVIVNSSTSHKDSFICEMLDIIFDESGDLRPVVVGQRTQVLTAIGSLAAAAESNALEIKEIMTLRDVDAVPFDLALENSLLELDDCISSDGTVGKVRWLVLEYGLDTDTVIEQIGKL